MHMPRALFFHILQNHGSQQHKSTFPQSRLQTRVSRELLYPQRARNYEDKNYSEVQYVKALDMCLYT